MTVNPEFQIMIKAFFGKVQKINADFKDVDFENVISSLSQKLCNESQQIDFNKFEDDATYHGLLSTYCTALALKQANSIFNGFKERAKTEAPKPDVTSNENGLIPKGWKVINGGKK